MYSTVVTSLTAQFRHQRNYAHEAAVLMHGNVVHVVNHVVAALKKAQRAFRSVRFCAHCFGGSSLLSSS